MENDIEIIGEYEIHPKGAHFAVVHNGCVCGTYATLEEARQAAMAYEELL